MFLGSWFDTLIVIFMITHIPTTLLVDSQSVVPREWFPLFAKELLDWHIKTNNDTLVSLNPPWFVAMVWGEVLLQLPFFFVAAYAFIYKQKWIRIPALIYGVHTATTLMPIIGQLLADQNYKLAAIYSPYFIVPFLLAWKMATVEDPFSSPSSKRKQN